MLARLLARGYPVPLGVVLSAAPSSPAPLDDVAAIAETLRVLELAPPWVVRSSSSAEDGAAAAFPGIFHTELGVRDTTELASAISRVRESLDGSEVKSYAAARGVARAGIRMGVLIQSQLHPRVAGVAFTRNPLTGADQVGIEANYGLGETVVDGSVTPDYFAITRDRAITIRRIGSKREKVIPGPNGLERVPVPAAARAQSALSEADAIRVAQLAWALEADLNAPQDVEWALVDDTLFLLQTRPITTGGMT